MHANRFYFIIAALVLNLYVDEILALTSTQIALQSKQVLATCFDLNIRKRKAIFMMITTTERTDGDVMYVHRRKVTDDDIQWLMGLVN